MVKRGRSFRGVV